MPPVLQEKQLRRQYFTQDTRPCHKVDLLQWNVDSLVIYAGVRL